MRVLILADSGTGIHTPGRIVVLTGWWPWAGHASRRGRAANLAAAHPADMDSR